MSMKLVKIEDMCLWADSIIEFKFFAILYSK